MPRMVYGLRSFKCDQRVLLYVNCSETVVKVRFQRRYADSRIAVGKLHDRRAWVFAVEAPKAICCMNEAGSASTAVDLRNHV